MNLLLDTHVALWAVNAPELLPAEIKGQMCDDSNMVFVSSAAVSEIAIKYSIGKRLGIFPFSAGEAVGYFERASFVLLHVTPAHAATAHALCKHHHDPFDRLLVAQAMLEGMRLITADPVVARYSDRILLFEAQTGR